MDRRVHYIDWLRVGAVLLLFPFHTARIFSGGDFYVKSAYLSGALDTMLAVISPWHMPLLFFVAGASTYFALRKRTPRRYLGERATRLLVPLIFGALVLIPPQTWYGARFNSGYTASYWAYLTSGDFLVANIQNGGDYYGGFGLGHLWFILYLFLMALVALPLLWWLRSGRGERIAAGLARTIARPAGWLLVTFLILAAEGLPDLVEGKNFFTYLVFFLLGYVAMSDEAFQAACVRVRWLALGLGAALAIYWVATGPLRDSLPDPSLEIVAVVLPGFLGMWLVIVGLMGVGQRAFDKRSPALDYLNEASYPLYILHQTVIVVAAFYVVMLPGPWAVQWLLLLAIAVAVTFGLYEIVRRVPALRFLFGMRPRPAQISAQTS